ncbi:MAG: flippase-like domain-containing protein, partial [Candidatus Latescibacteria bacterium]|nr:flippase-like domain-containing protein [Candidatus Latescibacterota bacterium]
PVFLLIALGVFLASGILGAAQWAILLRFHGITPPFPVTVSRYFMGLFFNYILPGFIGGDIVRVYQASRGGKSTRAFSSTLADRVIGLLVLVLFSLGAFLFLDRGPANEALPAALILFLALAGFAAFFRIRRLGDSAGRIFGRFAPEKAQRKLKDVYDEMNGLTGSPGVLAAVAATSVLIQAARISVHYLCGRAVGIEAGFLYFALFVPVMEIVASLPVSIGGVGVRETIGVTLFSTIGVARPFVVAYSLLATLTGFVGSLPGGAAFALKKR